MASEHDEGESQAARDLAEKIQGAIHGVGWTSLPPRLLALRKRDSKGVFVEGAPPRWNAGWPPLEVVGFVRPDGLLEGAIRIHCIASESSAGDDVKKAPRLQSGVCADLVALKAAIQQTIDQRELVMRRIRRGEPGPYLLDGWRWDTTNPAREG